MRWLVAVGLAAAIGWQWFPSSPEYFLHGDSGVWVHIARRMLEGAKPYVDVWDHKSPGILWIHVATLSAAGGQLWGVWLAAIASLACALWISGKLASERFGGAVAGWLAMAWAWICLAEWLDHVDYTEVFVLPLQGVLLWLALRERNGNGWARWEACFAGGLTACAILLRPNLAGTGLAVVAFAGPRAWLMAGAGGAGVLSAATAAAWSGGWLAAMIDAVGRFNVTYSGWHSRNRVLVGYEVAQALVLRGIAVAAPIGLWAARARRQTWILVACVAAELTFSLIGGKFFGHYFLPVVVPTALLAAAAWEWAKPSRLRRIFIVGLAALPFWLVTRPILFDASQARTKRLTTTEASAAAAVRRLSNSGDRVLAWDGHQWAQSLTERREVTRHFYWVKLYVSSGWERDVVRELSAALAAGRAEFVSEGNREHNPFPPIPRAERPGRPGTAELNRLADWVEDHFEVVARGKDYRVWRRRTD